MANPSYHEPIDKLSETTQDLHRALRSLMEELEAIDWYQQRVDATSDAALRRILAHNRDEEIEHAAMTLEWIRRHHPAFDAALRTYLFTEGDVTALEERASGATAGAPPTLHPSPLTTIGSLRQRS
ncbi:MAG: ferritin-like domain-containing protein [Myxococcales bacterium]|nr:ferritin-like domain-containing protein [Myxococcota bacterium]MDW8280481.1 ferritin-like domain-containing protein [Myxococcales bacterium]